MPRWCARRGCNGGWSTAPGWTGWSCATASRLFESGNKERLTKGLAEMAMRIGFRIAEGLAERVVYREFFPRGLTALDDLDHAPGASPSPSHLAARQEVTGLMQTIRLPLDARGQQRAAAQAEWMVARAAPLEVHDVIAE